MKTHDYSVSLNWVGNLGSGTSSYRAYSRDHTLRAEGKADIEGSSDKIFHGNPKRWNPEEMLIGSLSQCHMLSFLHVASEAGIVVLEYSDAASGTLELRPDGGGHMTAVVLRPRVVVTAVADEEAVNRAHHRASELCFIANSMNFPVTHKPECEIRASH